MWHLSATPRFEPHASLHAMPSKMAACLLHPPLLFSSLIVSGSNSDPHRITAGPSAAAGGRISPTFRGTVGPYVGRTGKASPRQAGEGNGGGVGVGVGGGSGKWDLTRDISPHYSRDAPGKSGSRSGSRSPVFAPAATVLDSAVAAGGGAAAPGLTARLEALTKRFEAQAVAQQEGQRAIAIELAAMAKEVEAQGRPGKAQPTSPSLLRA